MSTLTHFSLYQVISSEDRVLIKVLCQEKGYVDILNTIYNRDCFTDCSLDLTLTVPFWKIVFLVCC